MRRPKAIPSEGTTRVFISATSKDLGTVRELVEEALLTMGCMPIEQTNFPPDYRSVREMIEEKVAGCEAVIHIVGIRYGAEPDPSTLPEGAARRSYTQMEADIARKLGKKLYLFVCPEDFPYDQAPAESEELQGLQQAYRAEIAKGEILRTEVTDREELGRKVRELQFELEKLKSKIGKDRRRVAVSLVVLLLLLGGIGAGIWWWLPGVVKKEVGYDRGRAREQLVADIKAEAQKKIAEAGDDWRKTIEIEKWRDQQLADLDRFLDRIQQTFDAGEATESYRKATDLLAAKGADEALAYLQARSNQRKSQIEMQANRRDQEEADLRNLLQEELLAASLLETKFRFDDAEAKYREVLEKSGSWPKARNDFAWFLIQRGEVIDPAAGNAKLQEALELCRGTLAFASRQTAPQDWAMTQNNLGSVLEDLGERASGEQGAQYLEQSVAAYRAALEVRTREQLPQDWAMTQNNLGNVLRDLGERASGEQGAQYLEQSVAAYRAALEVQNARAIAAGLGHDAEQSGHRAHESWRTGERGTRCAVFRAVGGRLSRGLGSANARAIAAGLGHDAEQSGQRAQRSWRTGERRTRCAVSRAVGGRLSGGLGSLNARAIAAGLGHDAEQSGQRAQRSWRTGERGTRCAVFRAVGGRLSGGLGSLHARAIAAGLGHDAEQSGQRAQRSWRTGERGTRCAVFRAVGGRLSCGLGSVTRASNCRRTGPPTQNNLGIVL